MRERTSLMEGYVRCHHCGKETPAGNLNCIFCGCTLPHRLGVFTGLRYGWKGALFLAMAVGVIVAFLLFVL